MAALRYDNEILQMYYAPIPQEVKRRLKRPLRLFDQDTVIPHPVAWPNERWVDVIDVAKDEFEVDDASAIFSAWEMIDKDDNLLDARMTDQRAAGLLASMPEGNFILRIKFLWKKYKRRVDYRG